MTNILGFQRESFKNVISEALPLLIQHWMEIAHYRDIPLAIDQDGYERVEAADMLRIYTARRAGVLVGYAAFFVSSNAHYSTSKQAKQDVIYVEPSSRGAFVGLRLLKYCDQQLAAEGVQVVYHHVKLQHPALGKLLEHQGYEPIETTYGRRLDVSYQPQRRSIRVEDTEAI